MNKLEMVKKMLSEYDFDNKAWLGYPNEHNGTIYINAKGSEITIAKIIRDMFANLSLKDAQDMIFTKKNGKLAVRVSSCVSPK